MPSCSFYLAGKIKKKHETNDEAYWSEADMASIRKHLDAFDVHLMNPGERSDDLTDQESVLGRDMTQVFIADAVFVDARDRRGLGVGAEMMWAKMHGIPVITLAPKGTTYHLESTTILDKEVAPYIHPFVNGLSDVIVESIEQGCAWMKAYLDDPSSVDIKAFFEIKKTMSYYLKAQFQHDEPMRTIIENSPELAKRLDSIGQLK